MPKNLRVTNLPPKLVAFRSLNDGLQSAIDYRISLLAELHGHPAAAHVFSLIVQKLDLSSINSLKQGIINLRNVSKFSADILSAIPKLRTSRYQIQRTEIEDYISLNSAAFGMPNIGDDLGLVSSLITSSELPNASWMLDMTEDGHNPFIQLSILYNGLLTSRVLQGNSETNNKKAKRADGGFNIIDYSFVGNDPPFVYSAVSDDLVSLGSELPTAEDTQGLRAYDSAPYTIAEREDTVLRIADMRLLDHVLMLILNPELWSVFVAPGSKGDDESCNHERIMGLKLMAAFMHSLLLLPAYFRLEIFRQGYLKMEEWLGDFPEVPADILANYNNNVAKYDVFDVAHDVAGLYSSMEDRDRTTLGSEIQSFFSELTHMYGIDDIVRKADSAVANVRPQLQIEDLSALKNPIYNFLLLSHPIGRYNLIPTLTRRLMETEAFKKSLNNAYFTIIPMVARFLQDNYLDPLKMHSYRVPFPLFNNEPITDGYLRGTVSTLQNSQWRHRNHAYAFTFSNEEKFNESFEYKCSLASAYVIGNEPLCSISLDAASSIRKDYGARWSTLYPDSLIHSTRIFESAVLLSTEDHLMTVFEFLSGSHKSMIERLLPSLFTQELWATELSGFGLLWYCDPADVQTKAIETMGIRLRLIEGLGYPYGCSYSDLAELQKYDETDKMIKVAPGIWFTTLKRYPLPSRTLDVAAFDMGVPYYYFRADLSATVEVKRWAFSSETLLQMALRPLSQPRPKTNVIFDRTYAYSNESILIESVLDNKLQAMSMDDYSLPVPLRTSKWDGDKFLPFIEFRNFGAYGSTGKLAGNPDEQMRKLVIAMENEIEQVEQQNPERHSPTTDPGLPIDIPNPTLNEKDVKNKSRKKPVSKGDLPNEPESV